MRLERFFISNSGMLNLMDVDVLYIALNRESDRIIFMNDWLSSSGVKFERISGIEVEDGGAEERYDRASRLQKFGYDLTAAEVGCFLAHRKCWSHCETTGRLTMILESDIYPTADENLSALIASINSARNDFDLLRLHGIFEQNELLVRRIAPLEKIPNLDIYQTLGDPMGAGAYVLTPTAAGRLLEKSNRFHEPLDVFLASTWKHRLRFRVIKPYPFKLKEFESVIGERRRPKQSVIHRLKIELARAIDDLKRIAYLPWHFWG